MKSFLLALGFIACFILGGYTSFRFGEYYNKMLRGQRPRPRRAEPDIFDIKREFDMPKEKEYKTGIEFDIDDYGHKAIHPVCIEKQEEKA